MVLKEKRMNEAKILKRTFHPETDRRCTWSNRPKYKELFKTS